MATGTDWSWNANNDWKAESIYDQQCSWAPRRDIHAGKDGELLSHTNKTETDYTDTLGEFAEIIEEMRKIRSTCIGCGHEYIPEDNLSKFGCRVHLCPHGINAENAETFGCTGLPTSMPSMSPPCTPSVHTSTTETFDTYVTLGHNNFIAIPSALAGIPYEKGGLKINERHIAGQTEHNVYLFCNARRIRDHKPYDTEFLERIRELDMVYLGESLSLTEEKRIREMPLRHIVTVKRGELPPGAARCAQDGLLWETPLDVPTTDQLLQFLRRK